MTLNIKDDETVAMISELASRLGKTKTGVVRELAQGRLSALDRERSTEVDSRVAEFTALLQREIWPITRGTRPPTKREQEPLLGYDEIVPR
jgi:hypothetical protein